MKRIIGFWFVLMAAASPALADGPNGGISGEAEVIPVEDSANVYIYADAAQAIIENVLSKKDGVIPKVIKEGNNTWAFYSGLNIYCTAWNNGTPPTMYDCRFLVKKTGEVSSDTLKIPKGGGSVHN